MSIVATSEFSAITTSMKSDTKDFNEKITNNEDTEIIFKKNNAVKNRNLKKTYNIDIKHSEKKITFNPQTEIKKQQEKTNLVKETRSILRNSLKSSESLQKICLKSVKFIDEVIEDDNEVNEENDIMKLNENLTENKVKIKDNLNNKIIKKEENITIINIKKTSNKQLVEIINIPSIRNIQSERLNKSRKEDRKVDGDNKVSGKCCIIY